MYIYELSNVSVPFCFQCRLGASHPPRRHASRQETRVTNAESAKTGPRPETRRAAPQLPRRGGGPRHRRPRRCGQVPRARRPRSAGPGPADPRADRGGAPIAVDGVRLGDADSDADPPALTLDTEVRGLWGAGDRTRVGGWAAGGEEAGCEEGDARGGAAETAGAGGCAGRLRQVMEFMGAYGYSWGSPLLDVYYKLYFVGCIMLQRRVMHDTMQSNE